MHALRRGGAQEESKLAHDVPEMLGEVFLGDVLTKLGIPIRLRLMEPLISPVHAYIRIFVYARLVLQADAPHFALLLLALTPWWP